MLRINEFWEREPKRELSCFTYVPERYMLIAGCSDGHCMAWDIKTGKEMFAIFCHPVKVTTILPSSQDTLYTGSEDYSIKSFYTGNEVCLFYKTSLFIILKGKTW
jgi:WD40 repeat protein